MRPERQRGFTLLEAMIAFGIAALGLVAVLQAAAVGLRSADTATRYEEALVRARSRLAALEAIALAPVDRSGEDGGGYRWRERLQPLATTLLSPESAGPAGPSRITLYVVIVEVSWQEGSTGGGRREVRLETRRLGSPPPGGAP